MSECCSCFSTSMSRKTNKCKHLHRSRSEVKGAKGYGFPSANPKINHTLLLLTPSQFASVTVALTSIGGASQHPIEFSQLEKRAHLCLALPKYPHIVRYPTPSSLFLLGAIACNLSNLDEFCVLVGTYYRRCILFLNVARRRIF